ncbi:MAG: alanine--tRNA ligase [Candidatus Omnitrophota bacterium]
MKADIIRQKFLSFFKSKRHKIAESDSLVPVDDPTVLFTPAGMNQFKKEFLGFTCGFRRAATSQRCLRTDDLDKVGKTCGHHTFFEMLGNFSFGDYFKKEAIAWAWEFLTVELHIPEDKLWVSVYKDDDEAYGIWQDMIKVPAFKIARLGDKENFWPAEAKEKGPNGPCGPCSEIFYDLGRQTGCGRKECDPSCDCGRFLEVWNLVFTQFDRKEGGRLESLPNKNIDTGMGLERLAAVMQGVRNNFATDLFQPMIKEIEAHTEQRQNHASIYAIADHIRAITFAIYDGVLPSNDGRGYVVRKLIRKGIIEASALKINKSFLYTLVPILAEVMRAPYPELGVRRENIAQIILAEEKSFLATLSSSETLCKDKFRPLLKKQDPKQAGIIAFQLYDTYGLPLELTKGWLARNDIGFSQDEFNRQLKAQKSRSKMQSAMKGDVFGLKEEELGVKATDFCGYKELSASGKVLKIIKDNLAVGEIKKGDAAKIILDKSAFYAQAGGQAGDAGVLIKGKNIFEVLDTQKSGKVIVHSGRVKEGKFKRLETVKGCVDCERRLAIARNHTATHLLQAALRKVLGVHVQQQGSLVLPEKLRFDFTHFKDISQDELLRIEEEVNAQVINDITLEIKQMPLSLAKKTKALAFFGEKYSGKVRVVSTGDFSRELCAGTHLNSTGQIGIFKIIQEGSIASGIRRIEAVTARCAYLLINTEEAILRHASSLLNTPQDRLTQELEKRLAYIRALEKKLACRNLGMIEDTVPKLLEKAECINNINLVVSQEGFQDMDSLRKAVDMLKGKKENLVVALGASLGTRALLVVGVTDDLSARDIDAGRLVKEIAPIIGGSGGGRKDFAQAGGDKPQGFTQAFAKLKDILKGLG